MTRLGEYFKSISFANVDYPLLRELAGLSGQNKVPVVTEEEIEHSGLEVLKAVSVEEFESNGRIASNCVERVSAISHSFE